MNVNFHRSFKINTCSICKDKYYEYPYYHTSLDNLDFVKAENLFKSLKLHINLIYEIEKLKYTNLIILIVNQCFQNMIYNFQGGEVLPSLKVFSQ